MSKLLKEVIGRQIEKEIQEMFRIGKKVEESSKPRPLLIKFESLETKNMVLGNSSGLKDSERFNKVILSLRFAKGRQGGLQEIACRQIKRSQ